MAYFFIVDYTEKKYASGYEKDIASQYPLLPLQPVRSRIDRNPDQYAGIIILKCELK